MRQVRSVLGGIAVAIAAAMAAVALSVALPAVTRAAQASADPFVESFTPLGLARNVRQVSVRFASPMVALGDPRLADPFEVQCGAPGTGRWVDMRNWVYDFAADLPAGERCAFTLRSALRDLAGRAPDAVTRARRFEFNTGGPAIAGSWPRANGPPVDEAQVFMLRLDAPATAASVRANARCVVEGIGEQIPVEIVEGEARAALLRLRHRSLGEAEDNIALVRCQRPLPPGARLQLLWGAGIATASGIANATDQRLVFQVRTAFAARGECTRANARAGCLPMLPIAVRFNAPVPREHAAGIRLRLADGRLLQPRLGRGEPGGRLPPTIESVDFAPPFAENQTVQLILPPGLVDDAGRAPGNAQRFPLELRVDGFPPLAKFAGGFGILEANEGGVLPVTLRGLESKILAQQVQMPARLLQLPADPGRIAAWIRRVAEAGERRGEFLPNPAGGADEDAPAGQWREHTGNRSVFAPADAPRELRLPRPGRGGTSEVVGIPLKQPGFYVVEIESRILGQSLLGRDESRFVATSALVTNLAVHFKWGRESSPAWVTRLDTGAPVAGAEVRIVNWCDGTALWNGTTGPDGIASVPRALGDPHEGSDCGYRPPLMVAAARDGDFSFTQTGWAQGIAPEDFGLRRNWQGETDIRHTVLDRALFRAGEVVSMKHFVRSHAMAGVVVPPGVPGSRSFVIRHDSGQEYAFAATFGVDGIAESQWSIPTEARLGDYQVVLKQGDREYSMARFKVEQFRLPSMRASVTGPATPLVRPGSAEFDLHVAYLSGGGASGLPVRLRTLVQAAPVRFAEYDDYVFGGEPVVEGITNDSNAGLDFDVQNDEGGEPAAARVQVLTLDDAGAARVTVDGLPQVTSPARLVAELEYADANGELLTAAGSISLVPAALNLGLRRESWVGTSTQLRFRIVALDLAGKPAAGRAIRATLYGARRYSFRKRLVGGFYAYETTREITRLAAGCEGTSDAQGLLTCEVAPGFAGEVLIRAEAADAQGRIAGATTSAWVYDGDEAWFGGTSGDRMDLLPERGSYEPGDTARFQVRMPFRRATALVTVEREGVISGFVTRLDARTPVVDVPVTAGHAPNVFVSVLAVRGRVARADAPPGSTRRPARREEITGLVDLRKPSYRLGLASIQVGWAPHRLDVAVMPDKSVYGVRERARVRVRVSRADGTAVPAGTEFAFAAVDAALLDLYPNASWDLLGAMMGERSLDVLSSTAQMQVVGRRHYGRKAVPSGGGGGRDAARELFDSLLLWQGRLRVDGEGMATVEVPLNDSLSEFRLVAIAHGAAGLFGTGSAAIRTTQDLILVSGLPPLVREGDEYLATVSVRNATAGALNVEVGGSRGAASRPVQALSAQRVELAPGQSRDISWRVTAPTGVERETYEVRAGVAGAPGADVLRTGVQVMAPYPVRTWQATLLQLDGTATLPVERPAQALPGRGGLEVSLRARLGELDGVREYMRLYPYTCMEQLVSTAVVAGNAAQWNAVMGRLPGYLDRDGLLRFFPTEAVPGEDSLTAYVLAVAHEAGLEIPEGARARMLDGLRGFVDGRVVRSSSLPTADLAIRKLAAIDALARHGQANAAMLSSIATEPQLWPTSAVIDWLGVLRRVRDIPRAAQRLAEAQQVLRTRLNLQATALTFSTERTDGLWWLMISADSNANRLLLAVQDLPAWREDVPRLVRGALGRQHRGRWNTTVANAWGVLAMQKFSARFEQAPVQGTSRVNYGATSRALAWPKDARARETSLAWQQGPGELTVSHEGSGKPWLMVRATAAVPVTRSVSSGYGIRRAVTAVEQQQAGRWTRGDVVRVRLDLTAQSDMSWVVVEDPIPAGASILGSGLGGQSQLLQRGEQQQGHVATAFEERRFEGFRAYYRFVPKGTWSVEYTVRLNNPGTFVQPPTRVEAMYAPEMYGELPNARVVVER